MKPMALSIVCAMALGACAVAAQDTTSHSVQFVTVQPDVNMDAARVVRLPNAGHVIYRTNEADVLREMHAFMAGLK